MASKQKAMEKLSSEVAKVTKKLQEGKGKGKDAKDLDTGDLRAILEALSRSLTQVQTLLEGGEDNCPKVKVLEMKTRALEDSGDHHHQRSLKGKFVINSGKTNTIKKEKTLQDEGMSVPKYVAELVHLKLGVNVREEEITSCHHTTSGLVFRLADFKAGSTFSKIVNSIKTGQGKDNQDIFINFALTPRRSAILYEIRQLKKSPNSRLSKYYVDFDGNISVVAGVGGKKDRVTSLWRKEEQGRGVEGAVGGRRSREAGARGGGEARESRASILWTTTAEEIRDKYSRADQAS